MRTTPRTHGCAAALQTRPMSIAIPSRVLAIVIGAANDRV
jgi:hypothetical protein